MKRRCAFLDNLPAFNFNSGYGEYIINEYGKRVTTDTRQLGSTLMNTMLNEVSDFCDPDIKENWSLKPHQQVSFQVNASHYYQSVFLRMDVAVVRPPPPPPFPSVDL